MTDLQFAPAPTPTETILFLSIPDRVKLSLWTQGYTNIVGVNPGRLVQIQNCDTEYVGMRELGFIVDEVGYVVIKGLIGGVA